jgi:transposase
MPRQSRQFDLQSVHRVRSRLVGQHTAVINQIRGFLLEHGIAVRQGPAGLRQALPSILAQRAGELSPLLLRLLEDLVDDWRQLDGRIESITTQIETLAKEDENCKRLCNRYLRTLFVQGARAVLFRHKSWTKYGFGRWLTDAARRLHKNVLAIALANKLARIAWAALHRGSYYEPEFAAKAA